MGTITKEEIITTVETPDKLGICASNEHLAHVKSINGRDILVISVARNNDVPEEARADILCALELYPVEHYSNHNSHIL